MSDEGRAAPPRAIKSGGGARGAAAAAAALAAAPRPRGAGGGDGDGALLTEPPEVRAAAGTGGAAAAEKAAAALAAYAGRRRQRRICARPRRRWRRRRRSGGARGGGRNRRGGRGGRSRAHRRHHPRLGHRRCEATARRPPSRAGLRGRLRSPTRAAACSVSACRRSSTSPPSFWAPRGCARIAAPGDAHRADDGRMGGRLRALSPPVADLGADQVAIGAGRLPARMRMLRMWSCWRRSRDRRAQLRAVHVRRSRRRV